MEKIKQYKNIGVFILVVLSIFFINKYNDKSAIIRCYEEFGNSHIYPETFFIQSDFKEFCLNKGIKINEIGIDYNHLPYDYGVYIAGIEKICPFVTTVSTSECLDKEIGKQKQQYDKLLNEILTKAQIKYNEYISKGEPIDLAVSGILESLPSYSKTRDVYIEKSCSVRNVMTTGTAISEESRKCFMYYNHQDILMLEEVMSLLSK